MIFASSSATSAPCVVMPAPRSTLSAVPVIGMAESGASAAPPWGIAEGASEIETREPSAASSAARIACAEGCRCEGLGASALRKNSESAG